MFYDVLVNLCRTSCQTAFLMPQLKKNLQLVTVTQKLQRKNLNKGALRMKATCMVMDDEKLDFNKLMSDLRVENGRYSKCQLVTSMNEEGARINSSYMKEVDFNE
jgi:hypothetical protein